MHDRLASWRASATAARRLASIEGDVELVLRCAADLAPLDDDSLARTARVLQAEFRRGEPNAQQRIDAFALVHEAARRCLGFEIRDVQLAAGFAMLGGLVAEMQTGEGKTLAAVQTACFYALSGRPVHILTVNDYLARRDAEWMGPVYRILGVSVASVVEGTPSDERRASYGCDVTYTTARGAGFDFLRDSRVYNANDRVQRELHAAIVDEADSILIDEARIPLVLAGRTEPDTIDPTEVAEVVRRLRADEHYRIQRQARNVELTEAGLSVVEEALGTEDLYAAEAPGLIADVSNALHAAALLERDVDYIVRDGRIELVDELTGRVAAQRQWPDGLQSAIEAKEGVRVRPEGCILNSITMLHFLGQYRHLTGMTATAASSREEFEEAYGLEVLPIPRHRRCIRIDHPDRVLPRRAAKRDAVLEEVASTHATGRPVIVGTASIAESEELAEALGRRGVACAVLNAKNDAVEAAIVAEAGALGAVTISTNMAGRGTDIRLGGADEYDREAVVGLGGLHVIGTSRHESPRIDDQLRGRAGRQGDPGSSRFFVSLEDALVARYAAMKLERWPIESPIVRREIDRSQRIADGQNFETRKSLFQYSALVDRHRDLIYSWRGALIESAASSRAANPGRWPAGWLAEESPERYRELVEEFGSEATCAMEREVCCRVIDRAWGEHIAHLTELRTTAHLNRYAGRPPLDAFIREAADAFEALVASIDRDCVAVFEEAEVGADGICWRRERLETPSSTWTYMINDELLKSSLLEGLAYNPALALLARVAAPLLLVLGLVRRLLGSGRSDLEA
jgi:preprotein translocase subunit SecA